MDSSVGVDSSCGIDAKRGGYAPLNARSRFTLACAYPAAPARVLCVSTQGIVVNAPTG